jgi:hypothetical protein
MKLRHSERAWVICFVAAAVGCGGTTDTPTGMGASMSGVNANAAGAGPSGTAGASAGASAGTSAAAGASASATAGASAVTSAVAGASAGATAGVSAGTSGAAPSGPAATFSEIYEMLFPMSTNARCVACHSMPPNDIANGNLQMGSDKATAFAKLVGVTSTSSRCMNRPLVVASQPDQSVFLLKLSATPPCGSRMPLGGNALSDAQLEKVRSWISAGAKND